MSDYATRQYIAGIRRDIADNLSTLAAMRRAWLYFTKYIECADLALAHGKKTKKYAALMQKSRVYAMHYHRMFITYGIKPANRSKNLAILNSYRLDLGLRLIPISEQITRKGYLIPDYL